MDVRPFKALRPRQDLARSVCALPYDVLNRAEAKELASKSEYSFLQVSRAEINLADCIDPYSNEVYLEAKNRLASWVEAGIFVEDSQENYYIYQLEFLGNVQTGIVAAFSIDDYISGYIKKHELTRQAKEADRITHFDIVGANTEPVFLAYRNENNKLSDFLVDYLSANPFEYSFTLEDGVRHSLVAVKEHDNIRFISDFFNKLSALYIADGHHRSASAVKVGQKRRQASKNKNGKYDKNADYNFFMAVVFADNELKILDYNRFISDLNGLTQSELLDKLSQSFDIEEKSEDFTFDQYKPQEKGEFSMYIESKWFGLKQKKAVLNNRLLYNNNIMSSLDAQVLQDLVLEPLLGIKDPKTSERIDFIGGIRGLEELKRRVDEKPGSLAFALYPVDMQDIFNVADRDEIMPPKSTWFEPKLGSGLFVKKI
jgi:uncharacterized protein (DUF1015 family)